MYDLRHVLLPLMTVFVIVNDKKPTVEEQMAAIYAMWSMQIIHST